MKAKRPRRSPRPKSPFPPGKGRAPTDPSLRRQMEALERLALNPFAYPSPRPPRWVERAKDVVMRSAFPPLFSRKDPPIPARLGALVGRIEACDAWLNGDLQQSIPPEIQERIKQANRQRAKIKLSPAQVAATEQQAKQLATWFGNRPKRRKVFAKIAATTTLAPYSEAREFRRGQEQGALPENWITGDWMSREATLCMLLLVAWPSWENCRSVRAIHDAFTRALGPAKAGDLKSFHRLCRKIGFRLRGPGRPRKQK